MLRMISTLTCTELCAAIALMMFPDVASAQSYQFAVFDLGNPYGLESSSSSISGLGQVLVNYQDPGSNNALAIWSNGELLDVTPEYDGFIVGYGMNDQGHICGETNYWNPDLSRWETRGYLLVDGDLIYSESFGGIWTEAYDVNNSLMLVGQSSNGEDSKPFLWVGTTISALPSLSETGTAYNVNDRGEMCGRSAKMDGELRLHAVYWPDEETIIDLGTLGLGAFHSEAWDINDLSQIVGFSVKPGGGLKHAFLWEDGVMLDLGTIDTGSAAGTAINNLGQVVGNRMEDSFGGGNYPFIWQEEFGMRRLSQYIPPRTGWWLRTAADINDASQIVGTGEHYGVTRGYLAAPVFPTITISQPTPGLAGEINTLTLTNCTPGTRVYLTYATRGGGTIIPGCDIQENALQLENPKLAGSVVADANGEGVFTFFVPDAARNLGDILIQAVVPGECAVSNLVVEGFE